MIRSHDVILRWYIIKQFGINPKEGKFLNILWTFQKEEMCEFATTYN